LTHTYSVEPSGFYAQFFFSKGSNSLVYSRQVQKISTVISYIGGMVGAITALMFLVKSYTDFSFESSVSFELFRSIVDDKFKKSFHLFDFYRYYLNKVKSALNYNIKYTNGQRICDERDEVVNQLDIGQILKRLIFLEKCLTYLFEPHQLNGLKYQLAD